MARQQLRVPEFLTILLVSVLISGWAADRAAAEPARVEAAKITGCWRVWPKGAAKEKDRIFEITRLTDDSGVEGRDARGIELRGRFEPAETSWFGLLGVLVLHSPTERLGGYGTDTPSPAGAERTKFRHPAYSLEPSESFLSFGPSMAPGVVRTFAMFEVEGGRTQEGRGTTIGAAYWLYRCDAIKILAPEDEGPVPFLPDPPSAP